MREALISRNNESVQCWQLLSQIKALYQVNKEIIGRLEDLCKSDESATHLQCFADPKIFEMKGQLELQEIPVEVSGNNPAKPNLRLIMLIPLQLLLSLSSSRALAALTQKHSTCLKDS